jgi:hypothetical protein
MTKLMGRSDHNKPSTMQYAPRAIIANAMTKRTIPPSMPPLYQISRFQKRGVVSPTPGQGEHPEKKGKTGWSYGEAQP